MSINFTIKIYDRFVPADTELLYHALFYQMAILHEKGCVCHALQLVYQMAGNHQSHIRINRFRAMVTAIFSFAIIPEESFLAFMSSVSSMRAIIC